MAPDDEDDYRGGFHEGFEADFDPEALEDGIDVHATHEENLEERLEAAGRAIKRKKQFVDKADIDEFLYEYGDIAGFSSAKGAGNLLHKLVEVVRHTDEIDPNHVELLVRHLVEKYPDLLKYSNEDGQNPLFKAVRNSQHQLVSYMISTCASKEEGIYKECLNDALSAKSQNNMTCIHSALSMKSFDPQIMKLLIKHASEESLAAQDSLGKTPLHYAVWFQQCTDARADLIDLFIDRDMNDIQQKPRPTRTFLDLLDSSGSSVYQEHQKTRKAVTKKFNEWATQRRAANKDQNPDEHGGIKADDRSVIRELRDASGPQTNSRDSRTALGVKMTQGIGEKYGMGDELIDERERLRQKKKAEEAARLKEKETQVLKGNERFRTRESGGRDSSQSRPARLRDVDENAGQSNNSSRQLEPAPNTPIKRTNTAHFETKPANHREKPTRPEPTTRKSTSADKGTMPIWTKNSDEILVKLKLHYMRTRNAEMVISFLYGNNIDNIQIIFDYDRLPRKMLWDQFLKRFGKDQKTGLKFDSVLQYVTFPPIEIRLKGRLADLEREAELQSGVKQLGAIGRKDMTYFFDWLYAKGVRHIVRLSVEDSGDSGEKIHSDQAIQKSLERFIVESLDWQKPDLDPETILHVSSKAMEMQAPTRDNPDNIDLVPDRRLKELRLRWSGSNAVLRGWSESEGLAMLPRLERIYLFKPPQDKTCDNTQWINKKVKDFQIRLNKSRDLVRALQATDSNTQADGNDAAVFGGVEVIATETGTEEERKMMSRDNSNFHTSAPIKGVNSHRWLDSTSKFASEMIPFWQNTFKDFLESRQNRSTPERVEDDVVVALIDDGVDMFDTALSNQVLEGKSFDFHDEKVRPHFSSAKGHGTVMASMILRICPMAKVYPIRLKTFDGDNGKNNIDSDYAAQAIQAALDKKATIISMSWTLPMTKNKSNSKDKLHTVLQTAVNNQVLMFCSAPDEGKFTELDYPSGPWRDRFFRIGAARADGTVFRWTPDDGITYVLPGVDVVKDQLGSSSFETLSSRGVTNRVVDFKYETGSSVATALAAGLAAMLIYCVKTSIMAVKTANQHKGAVVGIGIPDNGASLISNPDAMKQAFASLGKVTPNNFIQVWEELDKVSETLEVLRTRSLSPEDRLKQIEQFTEFGRRLVKIN